MCKHFHQTQAVKRQAGPQIKDEPQDRQLEEIPDRIREG